MVHLLLSDNFLPLFFTSKTEMAKTFLLFLPQSVICIRSQKLEPPRNIQPFEEEKNISQLLLGKITEIGTVTASQNTLSIKSRIELTDFHTLDDNIQCISFRNLSRSSHSLVARRNIEKIGTYTSFFPQDLIAEKWRCYIMPCPNYRVLLGYLQLRSPNINKSDHKVSPNGLKILHYMRNREILPLPRKWKSYKAPYVEAWYNVTSTSLHYESSRKTGGIHHSERG